MRSTVRFGGEDVASIFFSGGEGCGNIEPAEQAAHRGYRSPLVGVQADHDYRVVADEQVEHVGGKELSGVNEARYG